MIGLFKDHKFAALLLLVATILLVGTLFYSRVEHWSVLDALYFSVITLTTVGYGDFSPHTSAGRAFTILFALFGIGTFVALLSLIAEHTLENYRKLTETYIRRAEEQAKAVYKKDA